MWMIAVLTSVGLVVGAGLLALISQPDTGQRVPIRYDPVAPARVIFDLHPETRRMPNPAGQSH